MVILNGIPYNESVVVRVSPWRPNGYFRISLRIPSPNGAYVEYIAWTGRIVPSWCAANYVGIDTSFTYTAQVDAEMANGGLKSWVLEDLGLEEYVPF